MPAFLEKKLKKEYGSNSKSPYKIMNSMGIMHGNKVTSKGKAMEKKHEGKVHKSSAKAAARTYF